jgi:hypothetical protein
VIPSNYFVVGILVVALDSTSLNCSQCAKISLLVNSYPKIFVLNTLLLVLLVLQNLGCNCLASTTRLRQLESKIYTKYAILALITESFFFVFILFFFRVIIAVTNSTRLSTNVVTRPGWNNTVRGLSDLFSQRPRH